MPQFTIGDVIRKAREDRHWNQERLGEAAAKYRLTPEDGRINKSTVSKVEKEPYTSELGTVWRLLAALNLTFADVERRIEMPFIAESVREESSSPRAAPASKGEH